MDWKLWIRGIRPRTLPASVAPVLVGAASASGVLKQSTICPAIYPVPEFCRVAAERYEAASVMFMPVLTACILLALFMQIAVNFANDYSDGVRGVDASRNDAEVVVGKPQRLVASGVKPGAVLLAAAISAGMACIAGVVVVVLSGRFWLLPVGVACLIAGWFYTGGKHPYGYLGFGEVLVFICFGGVATLGTEYALAGEVEIFGIIGACCTGLLSCVMLMVNNLRDIEEDEGSGKYTLAVRLGRRNAVKLLFAVLIVPTLAVAYITGYALYLAVASGVYGLWPVPVFGFLFLALVWAVIRAIRAERYQSALGRSGALLLAYAATHITLLLLMA